MTRLYLVRHPPVAVADGVCYGATDVPLAPGWERGVARALEHVEARDRDTAAVYASPLERCAGPARMLGRPVRTDARLRELDFGDWELTPWDGIGRAAIERWSADLANQAPPGGESLGVLAARTVAFMESLRAEEHAAAVAFTHAGVIRCALAAVLGIAAEAAFAMAVDFGSVSLAVLDRERPTLAFVNR